MRRRVSSVDQPMTARKIRTEIRKLVPMSNAGGRCTKMVLRGTILNCVGFIGC